MQRTQCLTSELQFLFKCLNLLVFNLTNESSSSGECDDTEFNSNFLIRSQLYKEFTEKLAELVTSAQIAGILLCSADLASLKSKKQDSNIQTPMEQVQAPSSSENYENLFASSDSLVNLAKQVLGWQLIIFVLSFKIIYLMFFSIVKIIRFGQNY